MAPINGPVIIWTPPSSPKSRPHQNHTPLFAPPPEDVVSDMTANSPQSCPMGHMKGGTYVNLFFPICSIIYLSVLSFIPLSLQPKDWFLCSLFLAHDWFFFSFRPSLLAFAGGISTQLPALVKKIKEEKEKRREAKEEKKSHGDL